MYFTTDYMKKNGEKGQDLEWAGADIPLLLIQQASRLFSHYIAYLGIYLIYP